MAKNKKIFECTECSHQVSSWRGTCPNCGSFGKIEERFADDSSTIQAGVKSTGAVVPVKKPKTVDQLVNNPLSRIPTGINELDRVLGGGFVPSEVVLLGGVPGSGKSTLSIAICDAFAAMGKKVLYSSGEESEEQIGSRAQRLGITNSNINITYETNLETLLGHLEAEKPDFVIVDSLQTLASKEIPGTAGSISQSREAAHVLTRYAKRNNVIMVLISQLVKSGDFSGSEAVQHIVDATIMFESDADTILKFLRATKNRFGATDEIGVFQHTDHGLEEVSDPSGILLDAPDEPVTGTSRTFISEGVRQIPVEIQALVVPSVLNNPRRQFSGVNYNRAQIVTAILDKFCNARTFDNDLFVATVSGMKAMDPQADLSMAASILSSSRGISIPNDVMFIGELSLTGQVRTNFMAEAKIREAERLGFKKVVLSSKTTKLKKNNDIVIVPIGSAKELEKILREL